MTKILSLSVILLLFFSCNQTKNKKTERQLIPKQDTLTPQQFIPKLDGKLVEQSGLIFYDKLFWSFNDSGGKNAIYGFNQNGEIKKEVELGKARNHDWESITQDNKSIYIGDFGNNMGSRKNLCIYKIKKKDIKDKKDQKVKAKKIKLAYALQNRFLNVNHNTSFDCEAMIEFDGNLYIFSKDWKTHRSTVYKIPKKPGDYTLHPIDTFNVNGLITGADISPNQKHLALVGYKNYTAFIWLFSNFSDDNFFKGSSQYFFLNKISNAQTEGICFYDNNTLLVSCEKTKLYNQQVFSFDISDIKDGTH